MAVSCPSKVDCQTVPVFCSPVSGSTIGGAMCTWKRKEKKIAILEHILSNKLSKQTNKHNSNNKNETVIVLFANSSPFSLYLITKPVSGVTISGMGWNKHCQRRCSRIPRPSLTFCLGAVRAYAMRVESLDTLSEWKFSKFDWGAREGGGGLGGGGGMGSTRNLFSFFFALISHTRYT